MAPGLGGFRWVALAEIGRRSRCWLGSTICPILTIWNAMLFQKDNRSGVLILPTIWNASLRFMMLLTLRQ